jgi:hypothetical protein
VFFFTLDCTILDPTLFLFLFYKAVTVYVLSFLSSWCDFVFFLKNFWTLAWCNFSYLFASLIINLEAFMLLGCWNGVFFNGLLSFIYFCIFMIWDLDSEADGKHSDKANAIRSKHSVTEQKRRSKINERFAGLFLYIFPSIWICMQYNSDFFCSHDSVC